jgi:hypothetical protein
MPKTKKKKSPVRVVTTPVISDVWLHLEGVSFLGRPIHVGFAVYETAHVDKIVESNTKKFHFASLGSSTPLLTREEVEVFEEREGKTLGVVIITDLRHVSDDHILNGDTLPFVPGADRSWRSPKSGHLKSNDETAEGDVPGYVNSFFGFDQIVKVEQVMTPAGLPADLDARIDEKLTAVLS